MEFNTRVLLQNYEPLLEGLRITAYVTLVALVVGVLAGGLVCALRLSRSRWVSGAARVYITFFRTVPEMVLIFWGYFCVPLVLDLQISGFSTGSLALGLVAAAYMAEIFRAGIEAVPRGQTEAALVLGLPAHVRWGRVVLPQALRLMVPPLVNYFTELLKNTTLLSAIGVSELALQAYLLGGQTYRYVEFLSAIAIGYFVIIFPTSMLSRRLEIRRRTH